jgi:hypothetical protein
LLDGLLFPAATIRLKRVPTPVIAERNFMGTTQTPEPNNPGNILPQITA